jgi:hypothetical protein
MRELKEGIGGIEWTWHVHQLDLVPIVRNEAPAESDSVGLEEMGHNNIRRLRGSG